MVKELVKPKSKSESVPESSEVELIMSPVNPKLTGDGGASLDEEGLAKKEYIERCLRMLRERKRPKTVSHSERRLPEVGVPERLKSAVGYMESDQFLPRSARKLSGHESLILTQLEVQIIPKFIIMH